MSRWADFLQRLRGDAHEGDRQRSLAILGLNHKLAAAADQRAVLTVLVDEAVRLFGAERGFLLTVRSSERVPQVAVARNLDREPIANPERKLSSTLVGRVLGGASVFSEDAQDSELGAAQSVADLRLRSVLAVPLQVGERVLGCLYLDHRFHSKAFAERDLAWLQAFADQGAIVLHLQGLLAENREQAAALAAHNRSLQQTVAAQAAALVAVPGDRAALRHAFPELLGHSPALMRILTVLDRIVETELPVLLTGESGTGKEVVARALHAGGARRRGPFVATNVAALAPDLAESELFGHVRGAFTGAERDRPGLLREATGGTLFLDEVTEMAPDLQVKLLRVLEQRSVRPVGGDREQTIDVRLIAATNRDVASAVAAGAFREDLYFRLAVVTVALPPLRERTEDLPLLAQHFVEQFVHGSPRPAPTLSPELLAALRARRWPGNVRQLRNEMQRLCALATDGVLRPEALSPEPVAVAGSHDLRGLPPTWELAALERWAIEQALLATNGNKAEAARLLGIGRRTLYAKLGRPD